MIHALIAQIVGWFRSWYSTYGVQSVTCNIASVVVACCVGITLTSFYRIAKLLPFVASHLKARWHNRKLVRAERRRLKAEELERERWALRPTNLDPSDPKSIKQLADDISDWVVKQRDRIQQERAKQEKEEQRWRRRTGQ
jgi:hypothetical protein